MVDVILATYNGEKYLRKQLDSLVYQTYQGFRILVRDDNSTDSTIEIINEYSHQYPESIVRVVDDKICGGSAKNFFELLSHCTSDYVMFCDQDDYWFPNKIETSLNAVQSAEKEYGKNTPILAYGNYDVVDENLQPLHMDRRTLQLDFDDIGLSKFLVQNYITGCLVIMNKSLVKLLGSYDESIVMHDWWAALVASSTGRIIHIPETLMLYRQHSDNVVGAENIESLKYRVIKFKDAQTKNAKFICKQQAETLLKRLSKEMTVTSRQIVQNFLSIYDEKNKLKRMKMIIDGNYLKSDKVRILGQLWYV